MLLLFGLTLWENPILWVLITLNGEVFYVIAQAAYKIRLR